MAILSLKDVHKSFGITHIIRGVSLDIEQGEKHAIIGPNGAGKSTLYHLISGLYSVTSGTIELKGETVYRKSIKRPESERMPINDHKGRLGVIRHVPSLHST